MKNQENDFSYADILDLPRPISKTHSPMPIEARAAQFAPYATLSGHRDIVQQDEVQAEQEINLDIDVNIIPDAEYFESNYDDF